MSFSTTVSGWSYTPDVAATPGMWAEAWQTSDGAFYVTLDRSVDPANSGDLSSFADRYLAEGAPPATKVSRSETTYLGQPAIAVQADFGTTNKALRWRDYIFQYEAHWYVVGAAAQIGNWDSGGSDEVSHMLASVALK